MRILAYDYKVKTLDAPVDLSTIFGRHDAQNLTITICTGMDHQHIESTILHEIIEAINWQLQLKFEEPTIAMLEVGLYRTLKDNGVDLAPLLRELKK